MPRQFVWLGKAENTLSTMSTCSSTRTKMKVRTELFFLDIRYWSHKLDWETTQNMETRLAALLYVGVIVPTAITIAVFIGFLVCLCKRSGFNKDTIPLTSPHSSSTPLPSLAGSYRSKKSAANEKFDSASQHSVDSAIDLAEMELAADTLSKGTAGILLNTWKLEKQPGSYQSKVCGPRYNLQIICHSKLFS